MKILMFLLRYLCLLALILVVVYAPEALQFDSAGAAQQLPCYESVGRVWSQWLQGTWYQDAWFLITAGILLILGLVRGVTAIWNVLYAISLTLVLAAASLFFLDLPLALPSAIGSMPELQFLPTLYRTDAALVSFIPVIFLLGLILSNARLRIFFYTVICYALWYGLSELVTYLLYLWQQSETPFLPELLAFLFDTRWLLVTLIGAFLLVYDLILAFGEAFAKPGCKPSDTTTQEKASQPSGSQAQPATNAAAASTAPAASTASATAHKTLPVPAPSATPAAQAAAKPAAPKPAGAPKPVGAPKPTGAPKPVLKTAATAAATSTAAATTAATAATAAAVATPAAKQPVSAATPDAAPASPPPAPQPQAEPQAESPATATTSPAEAPQPSADEQAGSPEPAAAPESSTPSQGDVAPAAETTPAPEQAEPSPAATTPSNAEAVPCEQPAPNSQPAQDAASQDSTTPEATKPDTQEPPVV